MHTQKLQSNLTRSRQYSTRESPKQDLQLESLTTDMKVTWTTHNIWCYQMWWKKCFYLSDKNPYCRGTLVYHMPGIPLHGICQMWNCCILNSKHFREVNYIISNTYDAGKSNREKYQYQHTIYQVFQSLVIERGDRGTDQSGSRKHPTQQMDPDQQWVQTRTADTGSVPAIRERKKAASVLYLGRI